MGKTIVVLLVTAIVLYAISVILYAIDTHFQKRIIKVTQEQNKILKDQNDTLYETLKSVEIIEILNKSEEVSHE